MSNEKNFDKTDCPASFVRRVLAFLIDCFISALPVVVICIFVLNTFPKDVMVLSPAPVWGTLTIYKMPALVDDALNTIELDDGSTYDVPQNVSFSATCIRIFSYLSIVFYLLYTTLCTYMYGKTIGKKIMRIEVYQLGKYKESLWSILRETIGKTLLNTTIIVPLISIVLILFTDKHRGIHDYLANTMVVES
ncbi:MAG: RDD family protein [Lachnospiraceae bacterium]|nr:RDD family protein [Lachnospiraceae bacterium]